VPSAGALYPLELYPLAVSVQGLARGIYHYAPLEHALEALPFQGMDDCLRRCTDDDLTQSPIVVILTAIFRRHALKYGDRGYRLTLMDCGCAIAHLYLAATALGLDCCVYGGFHDDGIHRMLGLDGINEAALAVFACGP
jgi:SagB-type dehydrogenase family enzyme